MNEHETQIKGLQKDRKDSELKEYLADNPEAKMYRMANVVELEVQKLRRRKSELIAKDAPAEQVKAIEERMKKTMERYNNSLDAFKKRQAAIAG